MNCEIESLTLIFETDASEYFSMTYWSDNLRICGFLGRPKGNIPRPAILYNRGGSRKTGILSGPELVPYVEAGYIVAASQYRGNAGSEGNDEFGGSDVNDVLNLLALLLTFDTVDKERVAMVGISRGGMMSYIALKQLSLRNIEPIKAAATVGGISEVGQWLEDCKVMLPLCTSLIGSSPDESPVPYQLRSAVYWPELIAPPLLLQHGEADGKVSLQQSQHLFHLLSNKGKNVKIITYPGDDHALTANHGGLYAILNWFAEQGCAPNQKFFPEDHRQKVASVQCAWNSKYPRK